jgi:hypothetical protein
MVRAGVIALELARDLSSPDFAVVEEVYTAMVGAQPRQSQLLSPSGVADPHVSHAKE